MSAAAVGREEVHYLVHLLSAAALLWFALYSLHVRHPTELLWAVSARRNASSASAEAVLTLTHHAPAWRTEACVCHPTEAFAPRSGYEEQSAAAPCAGLAQQQLWNADIPEQQQPRSAQNNPEQPRVLMFYHIAAMNNWQEVRRFPGLSTISLDCGTAAFDDSALRTAVRTQSALGYHCSITVPRSSLELFSQSIRLRVCRKCLPVAVSSTFLKLSHMYRPPPRCQSGLWADLVLAACWQVVSDQLSKVVFSGLYERMAKGFVTCCGPTLAAADECADLVRASAA